MNVNYAILRRFSTLGRGNWIENRFLHKGFTHHHTRVDTVTSLFSFPPDFQDSPTPLCSIHLQTSCILTEILQLERFQYPFMLKSAEKNVNKNNNWITHTQDTNKELLVWLCKQSLLSCFVLEQGWPNELMLFAALTKFQKFKNHKT